MWVIKFKMGSETPVYLAGPENGVEWTVVFDPKKAVHFESKESAKVEMKKFGLSSKWRAVKYEFEKDGD